MFTQKYNLIKSLTFHYSEHTAALLKNLPFGSLFNNIVIVQKYDHEFSSTVLKHALDKMKSRDLTNATSFVFQHLNAVLIDEKMEESVKDAAMKFCFSVLRHIVSLMNQMQDVKARSELKTFIFSHPTLRYLENELTTVIHHFKQLNTFPSEVNTNVRH